MTSDNSLISTLKENHRKKIEELENLIQKLQQEIELIKKFDERLDDL
jgi:hypothetical protein